MSRFKPIEENALEIQAIHYKPKHNKTQIHFDFLKQKQSTKSSKMSIRRNEFNRSTTNPEGQTVNNKQATRSKSRTTESILGLEFNKDGEKWSIYLVIWFGSERGRNEEEQEESEGDEGERSEGGGHDGRSRESRGTVESDGRDSKIKVSWAFHL